MWQALGPLTKTSFVLFGRFGTAEEAQRAYDQAVFSINVQHYRATNFPPGTLTAFSEDVDDRIRRHMSSLGMESAYLTPATWLLNQPAAGGHADPAHAPAAPAPAATLPAAPATAPVRAAVPSPGTTTWPAGALAAAPAEEATMQEQHGSRCQHSGLMSGLQHSDMMVMAAESPAAGMQPLPELDVLLQADMDAASPDYAALLDEIFTDSMSMPDAAEVVFGAAGMQHQQHQQQQVQLLLSTTTGCPPAVVAGWACSSATAVQQQHQVLGASAGSPPAAAGASIGPCRGQFDAV